MIKIPKWLADLGLQLNRLYYKQLFFSTYVKTQKSPSWFDHRIDLYYQWPHNLFWLERGVFPRKYMFDGCSVLDLFCGDGFFSYYFYSTIAGHIDAIDKDPSAISHAKKWYKHPKIKFQVRDAILNGFPKEKYDVIVWFEAIEHLNEDQCDVVMGRMKSAVGLNGVIIGSTPIISQKNLGQGNWEHQNEFTDVEELKKFLSCDFYQVQIDVTDYPVLGGGQRRTANFTLRKPK